MENQHNRIWPYAELSARIRDYSTSRIVLVGGCFDVLHAAHVRFLTRAKAEGDILIVALESDAFISEVKKRDPIHTQDERALVLCSLRMVDGVIMLPRLKTHEEYESLVHLIHPCVIGVTEGDIHYDQKVAQAQKIGAQVKTVIAQIPKLSTTLILSHESFPRSKNSI